MEENQPAPAPGGDPTREPGQPTNPNPAGSTPAKPAKAKRRRRWPWVLGAIVLLLLLVLIILPTLISSGIGRSIVVSQVNQRINGKVAIKDLSLGWVTPIRVDGVVIYDATGRQILQLQHFGTGLTLVNAARGNYTLGKTQIDGLDVLVSREADGSLNWSHLARSTPKASEPVEATKPEVKESAKLPNVEGEVVLDRCTVTYEDRSDAHEPPVYLRSVQANVKIPNINGTITDTASLDAQVGSAAPGKITLAGSLDAVKDNRLAMDSANIDQKLTVGGVDAAALSAMLGSNLKLAGNADAGLTLNLKDGKNGTVEAELKVAKFAAAGEALQGASLTSDAFTIALPKTSLTAPQGISNPDTVQVQIGDGKTNGLSVQLKNASVVQGAGASAKRLIDNDTLTVLAAGNYSATAAGRDLKLGLLKIADEQGIVSIEKDPAQDVAVALPANGNPAATGKIGLHADLKRLNDAAQAMKGTQVVAKDPNGMELKSGVLDGNITFAQASAQQIGLNGAFDIKQMTVGNATSLPLKDESLQLTVQALANHDLSQVTVPQLQAKSDLVTVDGHDIGLKLANGSDPKAPPVPAMQKLQKASLAVTVPSLAKVMALNEAISGKKAERHYDGGFTLAEELSTDASGNLLAKGTGELTNLVADGQANPEKAFRLANDLALNPDAKTLDLRNINIAASTTDALNVTLKGKVNDLGGKQSIQDALTADLAYDLEPLWKVLLPLMTPEQRKSYADVKVAGKYQKQLVVTGAYPAGQPFNKAVQSIAAYLSLQFDQLYTSGVTLEKADVPIDLKDGIARIQYHGKPEGQNLPPAIVCNSGSLNLGGSSIDLRTDHTLLTTPKELKVMDKVSLNPVFASTFLGKYLNNPLFVNAAEAAGLLNMTIHNCDALAVDDLGSALGTATVEISIGTLQLGNPALASVLPQGALSSFRGEVPAYHVVIDKGILSQDFTLALLKEKRSLKLTGQVDLKSKQMLSTTLEMPWTLFALKDPNLQKYLPEGIKIPFVGRSDSPVPALDVNQLMQQSLGQAGQRFLQDQLLGKNKNNPNGGAGQDPLKSLEGLINNNQQGTNNPPPASQPSQQQPPQQDPLKDLGNLFKKKKK
ncbi:MAG TPA: hypothetical protein VGI81_04020 [Tepidisphaeraceae bacterium]|jgi:hypothetical protein